MKKIIKFSKGFLPCAIISTAIIIFGIVGLCTKGINLGLDFKPGLIEEVRIAPTVIKVTYSGNEQTTLKTSSTGVDIVTSGNKTQTVTFADCPTVDELAKGLNAIDKISAEVVANGGVSSSSIYTDSSVTAQLSTKPYRIFSAEGANPVSVDLVRDALKDVHGISVKALASDAEPYFQIRVPASKDGSSSVELQTALTNALLTAFGEDQVALVKTDFVGSAFSSSLATKSILVVLFTMVLIWLYAAVRFHWDFAAGAIIALFHDVFILFTFIIWTRIEFSTTVLAAVLTIIGYSINATVVILDRVREILKNTQAKKFTDVLKDALTHTLSRSILTTLTTLFASISLYVFNTGSIKDFALVLTVGLISGAYSSIFISSGFIALARRHWQPGEFANHVRPPKKIAAKSSSAVEA